MLIPDFTGAEKVPQGLGGPSVYYKWYQRLGLTGTTRNLHSVFRGFNILYCETASFQAEQGAEHLRKYKYETGELFPKEGGTYVLVNVNIDCMQFLQIKQP